MGKHIWHKEHLPQLTFIELKFDIVEQGASGLSPSGA